MTLTTATQLTTRAQGARRASLSAISSSFAPATCQSQHQVRGFRFVRLWTSYFDPEFSQNACRPQRHFRYKYAETLTRRLSWDPNSVASGDAKPAHKRELSGCWDSTIEDPKDGGKVANARFRQKTPGNPEGIRPGQNIEDAERAPLEDLLFGHHHEQAPKNEAAHPKKHRRGQPRTKGSVKVETDYIIDPITNRKVPKPDGPEQPIQSFKLYRSQFSQFVAPECTSTQAPIFYDGPPPEAELKKYSKVKIDATPWDPVSRQNAPVGPMSSELHFDPSTPGSDLLNAIAWKHREVLWHHKDGSTFSEVWTSGPVTSEYTDLHKYHRPLLDDDSLSYDQLPFQQYEDLDNYVAVRSHEPDGKYKAQADAETKYEDLEQYGAVTSHQTDGEHEPSRSPSSQDAEHERNVQRFEAMHYYGPIMVHEPDSRHNVEQESSVKQYEDLGEYGPVITHEPDGKYKVEQESSIPKYEDLGEYGPVITHEPDGKYKVEQESSIPKYEDLGEYGPVMAHEPDGKYKAEANANAASEIDPEELSKYGAFRSHEPDGLYAANYVEPIPDTEELAQYKAFRSHEPDGKYAASYKPSTEDRVEATRYQAFRSHEPDGKYALSSRADPTQDYGDLETYGPFLSHERDVKHAAEQSEPVKQPQELGQYQAFRSHEPDGKYAAQSESCTEAPDLGYHEAFSYEDTETMTPPPGHEVGADLKEYKTVHFSELDGQPTSHLKEQNQSTQGTVGEVAGEIVDHYAAGTEPAKSEYRQLQGLLMSQTAAEDSIETTAGRAKLDSVDEDTNSSKGLTGNYVRDFPEDFTQSWSTTDSGEKTALLPDSWTPPTLEHPELPSSMVQDSLSKSPNALESALDRHLNLGNGSTGKPGLPDPYSKEPQGLETSYIKECGKDVPIYATIYNSTNPEPQSPARASPPATESSSSEPATPTFYKVLVYNPETQTVEIAETTSIVSDTSSPITPAEVLLRISHPSKFLPHFASLQEQGFEIVSGNGDVLVFREIRGALGATPDLSGHASVSRENAEPSSFSSSPPLINPIDMTGGARFRDIDVAASRYASPTGFVNYNLPPPYYEPEAVTSRETSTSDSSKSAAEQSHHGKTKSLPKRILVGALWLGGLSYSVAVVRDYFKTGGVDGKGTRGRL